MKPKRRPTDGNASHATSTESTSSQAPSLTGNETSRSGDAYLLSRAKSASSTRSLPFQDHRRKLSSRDYLLIQLSAENHSISELSKIFQVHRDTIRKLIRNPNLRCPICRKWKHRRLGVLFRSEIRVRDMMWICKACIDAECS